MKIVEICPFSKGICGVWSRVLSESSEFVRLGHEVLVLSSDIEKGTGKKIDLMEEWVNGVQIKRFSTYWSAPLISENVHYWFNSFTQKVLFDFKPDIIIAHLLHPHSKSLARLIKPLKETNASLKTYLVPHAPFNIVRRFPLNLVTPIWRFFAKSRLKDFDKIIAITKWELPYLVNLGIPLEKIVYVPNGLPLEYFKKRGRVSNVNRDVLFLGRIAPIKNIELIIEVARIMPHVSFSLVGMWEPDYEAQLKPLLEKVPNVKVYPPVYDLIEKIVLIDSHTILLCPSWREAMPQVILEGMARGKVVLSSMTDGGKELIKDSETGFLFPINDKEKLAELINANLKGNKKVEMAAKKNASIYKWVDLIKKYGVYR